MTENGQRYQPESPLNSANLADLEVAWAFGVEGASAARAQPAVVDGVMVMGSPSGQVYALDLATGCHYWTYAAVAEVRAAPTIVYVEDLDATVAIVADQSNRVYALDMRDGSKHWHADPDANPWAVSTGAPVVHDGVVFVPVSSMEVAGAGNPRHVCCIFRGNVVALDLALGDVLWQTLPYGRGTGRRHKRGGQRHYGPFRRADLGFSHVRCETQPRLCRKRAKL